MSDYDNADEDYDGGVTKGHKPPYPHGDVVKKQREVPKGLADFVKGNARNILPMLMGMENNLERLYAFLIPYINLGIKNYNKLMAVLEPYGIKEIGTCVTGFAMMFFGGFFVTTVAVWEAIVQGGLDNFKGILRTLYAQYSKFRNENKADDQRDDDNDGIADVEQISNEQYAVRKMLLALRATDPNQISQALHSLYTIFIAVLATLRLQFARTLSLGASIGDQIEQVYEKLAIPQLQTMMDEDYHKWLAPVGTYVCRFVGVAFAFRIQRILATFHTAVKGARTFTAGLTALAERNGHGELTAGYLDEALSVILAVMGIYLQLFMWTSLPGIFKLVFLPAFLVESFLSFFVSLGLSVSN